MPQVVGDLGAQPIDPERRRRVGRDVEGCGMTPRRTPRPPVDARGRRATGPEVDARCVGRSGGCRGIRSTDGRTRTHGSRRRRVEHGDAGRRSLTHFEVPLSGELLERRDGGAAGDAQFSRELARRGHGITRAEEAPEDAAAQPLDELRRDGVGGCAVDGEAVRFRGDSRLDWWNVRELDCGRDQCSGETRRVTMIDTAAQTHALRRIRRLSERQTTDRDALFELLDSELVGHLAAVVDDEPIVVPMGYARDGEHLLVHGSTGGGFALRAASERRTVAFAVTALDGLVFARSLFDSSMNYRSAVVYGVLEPVDGERADAALLALSERLMPGRPAEVRAVTRKESAATRVLRLSLDDVVMKTRAAGASEAADDGEDRSVWAGVVPLGRSCGRPERSALTPESTPIPPSVVALTTSTRSGRKLL